jgi:hypothetical protein
MIISTLTTDQLREFVKFPLSFSNYDIMKIAVSATTELLAAREAQGVPVACITTGNLAAVKNGVSTVIWPAKKNKHPMKLVNLFTAPSAPAVPDGYKLVSIELTDEIAEAIALEANCCGGIALDIYDAALAAAPAIIRAVND